MSRCFPYPPPGFEKSLALTESIKVRDNSFRNVFSGELRSSPSPKM